MLGIATIAVNPPSAAARLPVSIVSASSRPGSRRCTWRSTKPGDDDAAGCVEDLVVAGVAVQRWADLDDAAVVDGDVGATLTGLVEHRAATNHDAAHDTSPFKSLPDPSSWNSTAIRTATPLVTWSRITDPVSSAGSTTISTPRFIGPGCITSACGDSRDARSRGEAVHRRVLAQARQQRIVHSLTLHSQQVEHVEVGQDCVEVVGDVDGPTLEGRRQQRRRGDERDVSAERGERLHVAARDSAVLDVADDRDAQTVEAVAAIEVGANRVAVEQRLRRDVDASRRRR